MASLFSRLLARGQPPRGSQPPELKRSAIGPLVAFHEVGRPIWTQRSGTALTEAGYRRNAIVYRCVRLISEAAASVAISVFEAEHEDAAHPVAALLARPNPREAGSQFLEAVYGHLLLNGNAYLECVALEGLVRELHALRPDRMRVVPGPDGWPEAYEYAVGAETYTFRQDAAAQPPILHLKLFDPLDDQYGMPPLAAGQSALDTHNVASGWNKALLDNSARPSGALVYAADGANMTDQQFDRLKEELEQAFQGPVNAGRPILLEGGLDWKPLSMSPKDMDFMEAKGMAAREIALAFGVPPLLLGLPGDNTYANYAEANRAFWRQSVLPLVNRTLGSLSHWLTPSFGDGFRLEPDLDRIEALSTERAALWARVDAASFLSVDEKRAAVGYGPAAPEEVLPGADIADEAGVDEGDASPVLKRMADEAEMTRLKARLYDLELRYAPDQPRDDHGRWTSGGGGRAQVALADGCAEEWAQARLRCKILLTMPNPPRGLTGGYKDVEGCAKGFVSERCGGNPVEGKSFGVSETMNFDVNEDFITALGNRDEAAALTALKSWKQYSDPTLHGWAQAVFERYFNRNASAYSILSQIIADGTDKYGICLSTRAEYYIEDGDFCRALDDLDLLINSKDQKTREIYLNDSLKKKAYIFIKTKQSNVKDVIRLIADGAPTLIGNELYDRTALAKLSDAVDSKVYSTCR